MTEKTNRCQAQTKRNKPCGGYAMAGGTFCFTHSPEAARARAAARAKGGLRSRPGHNADPASLPETVRTVEAALRVLDFCLSEAVVLENSVARGRLLTAITAQYLNAIQSGEAEERLADLERWVEDHLAKERTQWARH